MKSVRHVLNRARLVASVALAAGAMALSTSATAAPVLGAQLFWAGGDVTITVLESTAGYTSALRLYSTVGSTFIAYNAPNGNAIGTTVTLTAAALDADFDIGDELIFGIVVPDNLNSVFKLGAASRNADNEIHGAIDDLGAGSFRVGFEDLYGGGDRDYDDNLFRFDGGVRVGTVPEPGSLALVGLALLGAAVGSRRLRRSSRD